MFLSNDFKQRQFVNTKEDIQISLVKIDIEQLFELVKKAKTLKIQLGSWND